MSNPQLAFKAYVVTKREGQEDWWSECGAAFAHADGKGYNILLQSLPIDGKIVLRPPKDETNDRDTSRNEGRDSRPRTNYRPRSDKR